MEEINESLISVEKLASGIAQNNKDTYILQEKMIDMNEIDPICKAIETISNNNMTVVNKEGISDEMKKIYMENNQKLGDMIDEIFDKKSSLNQKIIKNNFLQGVINVVVYRSNYSMCIAKINWRNQR